MLEAFQLHFASTKDESNSALSADSVLSVNTIPESESTKNEEKTSSKETKEETGITTAPSQSNTGSTAKDSAGKANSVTVSSSKATSSSKSSSTKTATSSSTNSSPQTNSSPKTTSSKTNSSTKTNSSADTTASPGTPSPSQSSGNASAPKSSGSNTNDIASAIVKTAKQYIGVPYVWGGTNPSSGFDCSGLTHYVFLQHGITIPRVSRDQFKSGSSVAYSNLKQGDLVFFSLDGDNIADHVGIYIGGGQFIHASSSKGVMISSFSNYWTSYYLGARRVL